MTSVPISWFASPANVASVSSSGVVTAEGVGNTTVTATAGLARDEAALTVVVDSPEIVTTILPEAVVSSEYEKALEATGGDGNFTWALIGGELPEGLTLSAGGIISGTPTAAGESNFTVEVSSAGRTGSKDLSLNVRSLPIWISTTALASAVLGNPYHEILTASGGDGNFTWSIDSGVLPDGLELSAEGIVSGTPAALGNFSFTLRVKSGGQEASKFLTITIVSGDLGLTLDSLQFALIAAGTFEMGSWDGWAAERPVHTVTLTQPFYMQKTEVTQAQWTAVMGYNRSWFSACGETCPVESVSWDEAQEFISNLNAAQQEWTYRLPTEAEWEYAHRAGTTGSYAGNLDQMAWYGENSSNRTHPVGLKAPNAWGLHDTSGNVEEWVQDWFDAGYYSVSPAADPPGPPSGTYRSIRGGTCWYSAFALRSAYRRYNRPYYRDSGRGFRLVRTPAQ
jgi:hypothetical protein